MKKNSLAPQKLKGAAKGLKKKKAVKTSFISVKPSKNHSNQSSCQLSSFEVTEETFNAEIDLHELLRDAAQRDESHGPPVEAAQSVQPLQFTLHKS